MVFGSYFFGPLLTVSEMNPFVEPIQDHMCDAGQSGTMCHKFIIIPIRRIRIRILVIIPIRRIREPSI